LLRNETVTVTISELSVRLSELDPVILRDYPDEDVDEGELPPFCKDGPALFLRSEMKENGTACLPKRLTAYETATAFGFAQKKTAAT
jgi:hypothetical protein